MNDFIDIIIRSVAAFAIMMVIARLLGKPTISQMTYHDFVAAITLGAITANITFNTKMNIWLLITALLTFSSIAYLLMVLAIKSRLFRKWISGRPTVLIQDGKILEQNMRKLKITLDTLNQELREKNIFNIEEVQYAVLEQNGKISVLRKPEFLPVIHKDLHLQSSPQSFPIELIMDGQIITANLEQNKLKQDWLLTQLKQRKLALEEVNYAVISSNGQLYFDRYHDQIQHPIDQE